MLNGNRKLSIKMLDQMIQLAKVTRDEELEDAELVSKLINKGYVRRFNGLNVLADNGIIVLDNLGYFKG